MDGDVVDLQKWVSLAKDHQAFLYVDEAHATGLFGKHGYGLTSDFGKDIDMSMGTFSKALGGSGAYITCSNTVKRYLINRCVGLMYSTAPSPMQIAAMQAAWELVPSCQEKVKTLFENAVYCRHALKQQGYDTGSSSSHIIPIILKDPRITVQVQKALADKNIRVSAIRSPSVPPNQSRLRLALTVNHSKTDLDHFIDIFLKV